MRRWLRAVLVLAVVAVSTVVVCGGPSGPPPERIGGQWYVRTKQSSSLAIEAGRSMHSSLYRLQGARMVLVDRDVYQWRFYAPDCVLYDGYRRGAEHAVFAACGDRRPVRIETNLSGEVQYADDGARASKDFSGRPLAQPWLIPIAEIERVVRAQPPFDPGWLDEPAGAPVPVPRVTQRAAP